MSCGGNKATNRNYLFISLVSEDMHLTTKTTARLFHGLIRRAKDKYGLQGHEGHAYARQRLYEAADREYKRLAAVSSGGWGTWRWKREFDESTATWHLTRQPPNGEPPGVDWREQYRQQAITEGRCIRVNLGGSPESGEGYLFTPDGKRIWGLHGASGILFRAPDPHGGHRYFLAKRAASMGAGGTWGFPGGAKDKDEAPADAALREFGEEIGVLPLGTQIRGTVDKEVVPGEWSYATVTADVPAQFAFPRPGKDWETTDARWLTRSDLVNAAKAGRLHPGLAANLDEVLAAFDGPTEPNPNPRTLDKSTSKDSV